MDLPQIIIQKSALSNIESALTKEWIVTNGLGGYASSTVLGLNTRKYHGLLIAAFLGANEFRDIIFPEGYKFLTEFSISPIPMFKYSIDDLVLTKTIFMPYKKNSVVVIYEAENFSENKVSIKISPLINSRHIYDVTENANLSWNFVQKRFKEGIIIEPSDSISSLILSSGKRDNFTDERWWVENVFFRLDASRSESSTDDYFRPGFFNFFVDPKEKKKFFIIATAGKNEQEAKNFFLSFDRNIAVIDQLYQKELKRRTILIEKFQETNINLKIDNWLKWMIQATDSFIVNRASTGKKSVIAGYSWFDDWGRDALISLPGLTLVTGKFEEAKEILLTFGHYCKKGIIPNRFSDKGGDIPLYNTVDATLWFFNAILQYLKYTGDFDFIKKKLWTTLTNIIDNHIDGTIFGIHMDKDGLITHGPQLTWMDAVTIDGFVTPRSGKAVEIQALWYNSLITMQLLAKRFNKKENEELYYNLSQKVKENFIANFWSSKIGYLYDTISETGSDSSLRPNQILAISLDFSMIDTLKSEKIVETVKNNLWGRYGLKTLPNSDSRYVGRYLGDWKHRDSAYHNGTVWAWLLGPFVEAFLKMKNHEESWRKFAFEKFLFPLFSEELYKAGLGTISEIFDGDEPHSSRGCISQAWSVAEPLRVYLEDIKLRKPRFEQEVLKNS
ncbi:MAG: amylo-alpha-1,6-glucosidase [Candidatus Bathyarchaeota archaeon]